MIRHLLFLLSLTTAFTLSGQAAGLLTEADRQRLTEDEKALRQVAYRMHTDSSAENRFASCKKLIQGLVTTLKTPSSYRYPFDSLPGVKVISSPDNSFRFFTWELHVDRDQYRHYGAIQFNTKRLKLLPLVDRGAALRQNPETAPMTNDNWLGYVIYDMIPAGEYDGRPYYFLFGFDRYAAFSRKKILDVLYFDAAGKPHFGLPVFDTYTEEGLLREDRLRIVLEYHAAANVALRFERENSQIVYENLILAQGEQGNPINLPDGSYHALEYGTDGRWHERSKVYSHVYERAPVPEPKAKENVNIFGRN